MRKAARIQERLRVGSVEEQWRTIEKKNKGMLHGVVETVVKEGSG